MLFAHTTRDLQQWVKLGIQPPVIALRKNQQDILKNTNTTLHYGGGKSYFAIKCLKEQDEVQVCPANIPVNSPKSMANFMANYQKFPHNFHQTKILPKLAKTDKH